MVQERFGLELVKGFSEINPDSICGVCSLEKDGYVAGFGYTLESFKVSQNNRDWLEWKTMEVPPTNAKTVVFIFGMSLGHGSPIPQPTGRFRLYLNGDEVLQFCVTKHGRLWLGRGGTRLYFHRLRYNSAPLGLGLDLDAQIRNESAVCFGLGLLAVPRERLKGIANEKATIKVVPVGETRGPSQYTPVQSKRWFRLDNVFWADCNFYGALGLASKGGKDYPVVRDFKVFFGDIHSHSGVGKGGRGCGTGTLEENFEYARDVAGLDIFSLTDHDWQMAPEHWENLQEVSKEFYEPGRFVTIPGFEWTSRTYGHRNVYYPEEGYPLFDSKARTISDTAPSPEDLWRELEKLDTDAVTIPHHPCVPFFPICMANFYNPRYDRLVEIYSVWGNSEFCDDTYVHRGCFEGLTVRKILNLGCKLGVIASSDSHDGHPGHSCGQVLSYLGSGWMAVLAKELTREAIWEAMKKRRCYGTTGEPIVLDFALDDYMMGEEVKTDEIDGSPSLKVKVEAPTLIERIQIVKDGAVVIQRLGLEKRERLLWTDPEFDEEKPCYYYAKIIQKDGEIAWSSPIWIV